MLLVHAFQSIGLPYGLLSATTAAFFAIPGSAATASTTASSIRLRPSAVNVTPPSTLAPCARASFSHCARASAS